MCYGCVKRAWLEVAPEVLKQEPEAPWLLRVLGLPLIMSAIVLVIFVVERRSGTDEAMMNAKGNVSSSFFRSW